MSAVRGFFARQDDPYAGGDLDNAQRLSALLWGLLVVLTIVLLPAGSPTEPSTGAGWVITALLIAIGVLLVIANHRRKIRTWRQVLLSGYALVVGLVVMQWVAGGLGEPYDRLLLLPVALIAATQPPRQILPFMLFVLAALAAPLAYDGWNEDDAASLLASFVIWCGVAAGVSLLMAGVRAQRLAHAAEEEVARREARIDSLTGLHNRRAFDEMLIAEVARARRLDLPLSVAMVDIESFKEINDRWSYAEGDRCLGNVAETLRDNVRQPDFCFRWGGDEFVLILSGTPADETGSIAERLHAEVNRICKRPDESPIRIRFAVAELREGMTPGELSEMAGLALTSVKLESAR